MSIAVLAQVYDEARRLAIAGSVVAAGDFRLKKLIPPLEKAGEKAPVFTKVAQSAQAVIDSSEKTASANLLELTTLVSAILYTQGETGIDGEMKPIETTDLGKHQTQVGARVLKPLLEALSTTGSGRLELIKDAVQRGVFCDLRLVKPALTAIDDTYGEIGDLIADDILPMYGKAILPELRSRLDVKGKGGHVRRLRLLHQLDAPSARDLVKQALEDGSKEMKVAAIECLGDADEDLSYLLEQTRAKAGDVRAAALRALANLKTAPDDVVTALKKAIGGADLEAIVESVRGCSLPTIHDFVLEQAEQQIGAMLKEKDKNKQGAAVNRLQHLLMCLDGRTDVKTEVFLSRCFARQAEFAAVKSEPSGADVNELLAALMARGTPRTQEQLVAARDSLPAGMFGSVFLAARMTVPPARVYEMFANLLKPEAEKRSKKAAFDADRANVLAAALADDGTGYLGRFHFYGRRRWYRWQDPEESAVVLPALDPRWLDTAIEARRIELVKALARPDHAGTVKYLSEELAAQSNKKDAVHVVLGVLETMIRVRHPDATDAIVALLKQQAKATHYGYYGYWLARLIPDLPRSALPELEAVLPTLSDHMVDHLMDAVIALKNKPE
jgi:hypothetical protein